MSSPIKVFFTTSLLLLTLGLAGTVVANTKYYQYDGKLPFVEMMLNMMVVMGILDKIPPQYMNGYGRYGSQYGNMAYLNNPIYRNALLKQRGLNPMGLNSFGMDPLTMSSLGMSPFGMNSMGLSPMGMNSLGLNPLSLNALKLNRLKSRYPGLSQQGLRQLGLNNLALNSLSLDQQRSPWSESPWDNALLGSFPSSSITDEPFVDDDAFQYRYSDEPYFKRTYNRRKARGYSPLSKYADQPEPRRRAYSPLSKLTDRESRGRLDDEPYYDGRHDDRYDDRRGDRYDEQTEARYARDDPWQQDDSYNQGVYTEGSPCVTELCGLGKYTQPPAYTNIPDLHDGPLLLDGLWITDTGEMLGIKAQRFLWSDGDSRYLTGRIQALQDTLIASVDGDERVMSFQYRLENNRLLTQDPSGLVRVFTRVPVAGL